MNSSLLSATATLAPSNQSSDLLSELIKGNRAEAPKASSILDRLSSSSKLLWASEHESPETLLFSFASRGVPKQVFRWTGWNASIKSESADYTTGLSVLAQGFENVKGFHFYNGTQIRSLKDGSVLPSVTDVPAALNMLNPEIILLGIIPKVSEEPKLTTDFGLVLKVNEKKGFFTTVNPASDISYVLQPDVNRRHEWLKEAEESFSITARLAEKGWSTNLIVYGGTPNSANKKDSNVEAELLSWARTARERPDLNIKILLIQGSGGVADKYANDPQFLAENPKIIISALNSEAIRSAAAALTRI